MSIFNIFKKKNYYEGYNYGDYKRDNRRAGARVLSKRQYKRARGIYR